MDRGGTVQKIPRCQCGAESFRLVKQGNQFSRWRFICTGCSAQKEVYQTDPFSLNLLKPLIDAGVPHQWSEINMIPVSYRASPVFYVQTARFIVFDTDPEVITLMGPSREDELAARVAMLHGFAGTDPKDDRIKEQLEKNGQGSIFAPYEMFRAREAAARASGDTANIEVWADAARSMLNSWYAAGFVSREVIASPALHARVRERGNYARRFDPIRSTIEHDGLRRRKVNLAGEAADLKLAHPDLCAEYGTDELQRAYERRVAGDFARTGIEEARLIRNLDMVEFSFGFSRVSATPETVQKDRHMPVRLMGFPPLPSNKRPIYVIEQQNEAIYIQLDAEMVGAFLQSNGVLDQPPPPPRAVPERFFRARRRLAGTGARHCVDDVSADPLDGPSRYAWYRAVFGIGPRLLKRGDIPRRPCLCGASARHDGRSWKHFVYVARPEQCISSLSRLTSRVTLRFWYALRPSRRRLSRLHHDSRNILHRRKSAAVARGACWRPGTAVGYRSNSTSRLL
jgi:hypothetical protein